MEKFSTRRAAQLLGLDVEVTRRWAREGKLRVQKEKGRLQIRITDAQVEGLRRRGIGILLDFPVYQNLIERINPYPIEAYFQKDPVCLVAVLPGGPPYALSLLFALHERGRDVTLIYLGREVEEQDADLVRERKVLIVDDATRTGETLIKARSEVEEKALKKNLKLIDIKTFVYNDAKKISDFWIQQLEIKERIEGLVELRLR